MSRTTKTVQYDSWISQFFGIRGEVKVRIYDVWPLSSLKKRSIALPIKLLSGRDRFLLVVITFITLFLAILDLFGVLLIGVIGSLSITGLGNGQTGDRVSLALRVLQIDDLDFESQVIVVGLIAALLLIIKTILSLFLVRKTLFFMARRAAVMSSNLIMRYFTIPVSRVNRRSAQTSIYALTSGVNSIMVGVIGVSVALISDIALLIVMSAGLFLVDPISAIGTTLIFGFLALVLYRAMHKKMQRLGEEQGALDIESSQRIFEAVNSYRELLVRDRRGFYAQQIGGLRYKLADGVATIGFMGNISKYVLEITLVVSALILAFYQFSTSTAFRAIATITIFIAASTRIVPAILRLQQGILGMKGSLAGARPTISLIEELHEIPIETIEVKGFTRNHSEFSPEVSASNIAFSYEPDKKVLSEVDFETQPGEFVAIVGGSGAGKTTLVDVLIGALDPQVGTVQISDMKPSATFSIWPGAVSYVPQDSPVINGTIKENICLGFPADEIPDEYCWDSLKIARLDDFVKSLPNHLATYVGDRGTRLSGGQRQRLGIARALITKPKLLILDEATSSLDGVTESEISESLRGLKGQITLIVIAHRLSTVVNADRIYFMEKGLVKGVGTFEELKRNHPKFLAQAELMGL
jgi:ATP-binding cassette, subfamily B, bacterial PglK